MRKSVEPATRYYLNSRRYPRPLLICNTSPADYVNIVCIFSPRQISVPTAASKQTRISFRLFIDLFSHRLSLTKWRVSQTTFAASTATWKRVFNYPAVLLFASTTLAVERERKEEEDWKYNCSLNGRVEFLRYRSRKHLTRLPSGFNELVAVSPSLYYFILFSIMK